MIESVLSAPIATEVAYGDVAYPGDALFDEEIALISRAVVTRRNEFTTVRHLARRALARIGVAPAPILPDRRGAPQWPPGVRGSMTHCAGYRAAAVSPVEASTALGIDAEPNRRLPDGVLPVVTLPSERSHIATLACARPDVRWDRMYFSAKESVFKAWYPLTRRELDFTQAEIIFDPSDDTFVARLLVPGPEIAGSRLTTLPGRWLAARGLIATAVHLPAPVAAGTTADSPGTSDHREGRHHHVG